MKTIDLLTHLLLSDDVDQATNASWALKNIAYHCDTGNRLRLIDSIDWRHIKSNLSSAKFMPHEKYTEQTLNLIRNLISGGPKAR